MLGIAGEPGIGKSRLLAEFAHSLAGQPITYCEGHCLAYGSTTPYLPIRDLLQQLWGLPAPATPDVLTATIAQRLHAAGIVAEADALVLRQLLDVPGAAAALAALSPQARRARTFTLLRQLCLHASHQQPLVLAVENLQWTDPTSEEWLAGLAARVGGTAILLLATYRPGYQLPWLAHSWATQVALPPLTPVDSLVVVLAIPQAAQLSTRQHQAIVAQAAGNPFFLEELAWAAGASGDQARSLPMPDTIQAVLAARLDHLPPAAKRLGQIAAVIGPEVPVLLLQRIADLPEATVHEALAQLQTAEILYETRLFPEQVYTFKHALTHEVTYGSLLQERRRILHTRIVEAMEALYADQIPEQVDRLAHHALRGERWDKAVTYCRQAGVKAVGHSAYREAATFFEQALAALAHVPESPARTALAIELHLHLGMRHLLGEYEQALVHMSEAEVLAQTLGDRVQLGQVLIRKTFLLRMRADHPGAIVTGQQALAIAVELGDRAMQVAATHRLAQPYFAMGDLGQAAALLRQNVEVLAAGTPDPRLMYGIQSRAWLALVLSFLGAFAEGRLHGEEALRLAAGEGQGNLPTIAYGCLGFLHLTKGDLEPAIWVFDQGLALCHATENKDWSRWITAGLGHAYALTGRLTEGQALLEDARRDDIRTGSLHAHSDHIVRLSEVCLLAGRQDEAWQHVRHALALARHYQERGYEALALRQLGAVQAHAAPPEVELAVTSYRQALTLAEALGMRPLQAHCHQGLGLLYAIAGQREQARVELVAALALYREMEMTFWLPQAEAALAQVAG